MAADRLAGAGCDSPYGGQRIRAAAPPPGSLQPLGNQFPDDGGEAHAAALRLAGEQLVLLGFQGDLRTVHGAGAFQTGGDLTSRIW